VHHLRLLQRVVRDQPFAQPEGGAQVAGGFEPRGLHVGRLLPLACQAVARLRQPVVEDFGFAEVETIEQ